MLTSFLFFFLVQRLLDYYPNYSTRRLYFEEVETPSRLTHIGPRLLSDFFLSSMLSRRWQLFLGERSFTQTKLVLHWYKIKFIGKKSFNGLYQTYNKHAGLYKPNIYTISSLLVTNKYSKFGSPIPPFMFSSAPRTQHP